MAYTPTTWVTGDTVTATKMNKIENGIASAGGVFPIAENEYTLDKTWNEIVSAVASGQIAIIYSSEGSGNNLEGASCFVVRTAYPNDGTYYIYLIGYDNSIGYSASSANGYPVFFD